jgi:hypothetical protein
MSNPCPRVLTRNAIILAAILALPLIAAAQSSNGPTPVPPTNPPPICNTGFGSHCPVDARYDHYDPANCPFVDESKDGTPFVPQDFLCPSADSAPIAHISCWDYDGGVFACEGEPLTEPGVLSYGWTASPELEIAQSTDPTSLFVMCAEHKHPVVGLLTLTVMTNQGAVGTATQALPCD